MAPDPKLLLGRTEADKNYVWFRVPYALSDFSVQLGNKMKS
jgi:hypothetical protein